MYVCSARYATALVIIATVVLLGLRVGVVSILYWRSARDAWRREHDLALIEVAQLAQERHLSASAVSEAALQLQYFREHAPSAGEHRPHCSCSVSPECNDTLVPTALLGAGIRYNKSWAQQLEDLTTMRVFVYPLPDQYHSALKTKQPRCVSDQYGTEIR